MRDTPDTARSSETGAVGAALVHVLVVDDEAELREMVRDYLARHGFAVSTASGGADMRAILAERPVHVVVLDLKMPGEDGLTLARYLRQSGGIGIIMLTASSETVDRVVGLELGADDYMSKPSTHASCWHGAQPGPATHTARQYSGRPTAGPARARDQARPLPAQPRFAEALQRRRGEIPLTAMEFDLLKAFAERPNRVLSRDLLLSLAHNKDGEAFDRSIDIRVMRLRKKIETDPEKPVRQRDRRSVAGPGDRRGRPGPVAGLGLRLSGDDQPGANLGRRPAGARHPAGAGFRPGASLSVLG